MFTRLIGIGWSGSKMHVALTVASAIGWFILLPIGLLVQAGAESLTGFYILCYGATLLVFVEAGKQLQAERQGWYRRQRLQKRWGIWHTLALLFAVLVGTIVIGWHFLLVLGGALCGVSLQKQWVENFRCKVPAGLSEAVPAAIGTANAIGMFMAFMAILFLT